MSQTRCARFFKGFDRKRAGIHLSVEENNRLSKTAERLGVSTAEVVRLSLSKLYDRVADGTPINTRLEQTVPSVYFEVEIATKALNGLKGLRQCLGFVTMNEVVRLAISIYCGS